MYNIKDNYRLALLWARAGYIGVVFIPVLTYHYIITFLKLKRRRRTIFLIYLCGIIFFFISRTNLFLYSGYTYFWGYYPKAGPLYAFFVLFFICTFVKVMFLLFLKLKDKKFASSSSEVNRVGYVLLGFVIAITSLVDYVPNYGIEIYPWAYLSALGWLICMGWAAFKYRLMEIKLTITRAGIFVIVYTLVLGLPFAGGALLRPWLFTLIGANWWITPLMMMAILATGGPFICIYLNRKAEERGGF